MNVDRDPRTVVIIRDEEDAYRYAEVRGEVTEKVRGQEAHSKVDELS